MSPGRRPGAFRGFRGFWLHGNKERLIERKPPLYSCKESLVLLPFFSEVNSVAEDVRHCKTRPRSCGRVMPQGCIDHAIPYVTPEGYQLIAHLLTGVLGDSSVRLLTPLCPVLLCCDQCVLHKPDAFHGGFLAREVVRHCKTKLTMLCRFSGRLCR